MPPGEKTRSARAPSDSTAKVCGTPPRLPDPGTGTGDELLVSHAEAELPLEHIHGFVLAAMDVERGPVPLLEEASLEDTEGTAGVLGAGLDLHHAALPPVGVLPGADVGRCAAHDFCSFPVVASHSSKLGPASFAPGLGSAAPSA
jgi:hypothetical protein